MKSLLKSNPPMTNRAEWTTAREFNTSADIFESCDFRSQFDPLYIIFRKRVFVGSYLLNEKVLNK